MRVLKGLVSGLTETSSSSSSSTTVELVLISGESGTGKSVLAESLRKPVEAAGGLFCVGKCSSADQGEPLSAITSVCKEVCQRIICIARRSTKEIRPYSTRFVTEIGRSITGNRNDCP
mmetsp:Transcript_10758/g.20723  ORF Transcript_10758/g.20723 Transcript_10758/m.20723 type:complete len:118 (+) Transcript_10758:313-666(+)